MLAEVGAHQDTEADGHAEGDEDAQAHEDAEAHGHTEAVKDAEGNEDASAGNRLSTCCLRPSLCAPFGPPPSSLNALYPRRRKKATASSAVRQ